MLASLAIRSARNLRIKGIPTFATSLYHRKHLSLADNMAQKRKASAAIAGPESKRRASARTSAVVNPDLNGDILDAPDATRASPDSDINEAIVPGTVKQEGIGRSESPLSDVPAVVEVPKSKGQSKGRKVAASKVVVKTKDGIADVEDPNVTAVLAASKAFRTKKAVKLEPDQVNGTVSVATTPAKLAPKKTKPKEGEAHDPEADEDDEEADEAEILEASRRPPPVNSPYLPLPWKGRLGYACLNTYLRNSNPPVFSSRTCRIQSILEHRHPLTNPNEPEHATKNRPDRSQPADVRRGMEYVEQICLANVRDIEKMVRWNDRYGIRFFRLSSEMFPFASHPEYGYTLAFASEALAKVGKVIAELGHRVTTHPGQFTQLGSPRPSVISNAIRDLTYHDQLFSLLQLPEQQNKDAVMILHMGGVFDSKTDTIQRFRENYAKLPQGVKNRLVLENDDVCYTVHDLLPVCEELNIPMVLDYHHHNILFDAEQIREGTEDIQSLYPRIAATWSRKGITQKMHYSEPTPAAITGRQRRKHNPRVATLPPCAQDMDLMIEAKDKEQAVFELMKTFKLPKYETFADVLPYVRLDDNKVALASLAKKSTQKAIEAGDEVAPVLVSDEDVGMGGPDGRVYWPTGMEEWLRPKKREVKKKEPATSDETAAKKKQKVKDEAAAAYAEHEAQKKAVATGSDGATVKAEAESESDVDATPATKKAKAAMRKKESAQKAKAAAKADELEAKKIIKEEASNIASPAAAHPKATQARKRRAKKAKQAVAVPTPSPSRDESETQESEGDFDEDDELPVKLAGVRRTAARPTSGRQANRSKVSYAEQDEAEMEEA